MLKKRLLLLLRPHAFILLTFLLMTISCAYADTTFTNQPKVQKFIHEMVKKHHFNKNQLITLFNKVKVHPIVIQHVKKPLEKKPWYTYQLLFVNEWRIEHGVKFWNKYEQVLREAEKKYKVPASIIVATIGIESQYGTKTGEHRVIDALTNIGFSDSERAPYFRYELEQFLLLTREKKLDPLKVTGSYAGAIGQPQFMPSSYRRYAIDFSKKGKVDLTHDTVDVIGSIANYYAKQGWNHEEPVVQETQIISSRFDYLLKKNKIKPPFTIHQLVKNGVLPKGNIPRNKAITGKTKVKMIELENRHGKEYWLAFHNFNVIKRYNASDTYAMAVYQLSHYIKELRSRLNNG